MSSDDIVGPANGGCKAEKSETRHIEQRLYAGLSEDDVEFMANYSIEKQKKAISKVDVSRFIAVAKYYYRALTSWQWRLIPVILFLYLIT